MRYDVAVIGAGPAGLAAATEAVKHGAKVIVFERLSQPGGLSRTVIHRGCRFDIGPHRFFTKNEEVSRFFRETLGPDTVSVRRLTRILFRNKLFAYPLSPWNVLPRLGIADAGAVISSYALQRLKRKIVRMDDPADFEQWVIREFGPRLYEMFFRAYTEKVWGVSCRRIAAEWAGQRLKSLNLITVVMNAFGARANAKSLINRFDYPTRGAGLFYEKLTDRLRGAGAEVVFDAPAIALRHEAGTIRSVTVEKNGVAEEIEARNFVFSGPLTELVTIAAPAAPAEVSAAAGRLRYREHIGVHLIYDGPTFPDNWVYVHSDHLRMARVANYRNFSGAMATGGLQPLTVEYFAFEGDALSRLGDTELKALAQRELSSTGLVSADRFVDGFVLRSRNAYPVIERGYEAPVGILRRWVAGFPNLRPVGRAGLFKYNNQDHAIATGLAAARNILGLSDENAWDVNVDPDYHEEVSRRQP